MKLPLAHGIQARAMAHALPWGTELRDAVAELPLANEFAFAQEVEEHSCNQFLRTHIEGQAWVKAEQSSNSTRTGEKRAP